MPSSVRLLSNRPLLVTGSAGFIGANFVLDWFKERLGPVVSLDKLTYAGQRGNLSGLDSNPDHTFIKGDIRDKNCLSEIFSSFRPWAIVNFAAETHVDRSIQAPEEFVLTNVVGAQILLEAARGYMETLNARERQEFRFIHISTDEVYGTLGPHEAPFSEITSYKPNSPYAASKAASDHLVRAYHHTYGLNTIITNCSNNYGPYQFPEKLIPLMINNALSGKPLPLYGDGLHIRDWLYVGDHCAAIRSVLEQGRVGESYNIGGKCERTNIDLVQILCATLDRLAPRADGHSYNSQITHIKDRPGHDRRYAIDTRKIEAELHWTPQENLKSGIEKTAAWYLAHPQWVAQSTGGSYPDWIRLNYEAGMRAK